MAFENSASEPVSGDTSRTAIDRKLFEARPVVVVALRVHPCIGVGAAVDQPAARPEAGVLRLCRLYSSPQPGVLYIDRLLQRGKRRVMVAIDRPEDDVVRCTSRLEYSFANLEFLVRVMFIEQRLHVRIDDDHGCVDITTKHKTRVVRRL